MLQRSYHPTDLTGEIHCGPGERLPVVGAGQAVMVQALQGSVGHAHRVKGGTCHTVEVMKMTEDRVGST